MNYLEDKPLELTAPSAEQTPAASFTRQLTSPPRDSDAPHSPLPPATQSSLTQSTLPSLPPPSPPSSLSSSSGDSNMSTSTCLPVAFLSSPPQQSLTHILSSLASDPDGCIVLGQDCVLRSLTARREVVDAVGLEPEMVKALGERMAIGEEEVAARLGDGTKVPKEKWSVLEEGKFPEGEEGETDEQEGVEEGTDEQQEGVEEETDEQQGVEEGIGSEAVD
ncbi:MAG: hypothetical protein Q9160_004045 [Pyrenula sp. 1 TL-2023]